MPLSSSSPRDRTAEDKVRRRRRDYDDHDRTAYDKPPRSSRHKTSTSDRKLSSGSLRPRSRSHDREVNTQRSSNTLRSSGTSDRGVPEMERRSDGSGERSRGSYPSFSKAHSREAVGSREQINVLEADRKSEDGVRDKRRNSTPINNARPASPTHSPKTPDIRRARSRSDMRDFPYRSKAETSDGGRKGADTKAGGAANADTRTGGSVKPAKSGSSLRREAHLGASEVSSMPGAFPDEPAETKSTPTSSYRRTASTNSQPQSTITQNTIESFDSEATSVAAGRKSKPPAPEIIPVNGFSTTSSAADKADLKTPTPSEPNFPQSVKSTPIYDVGGGWESMGSGRTQMGAFGMAPPPPPPPPPMAGSAAAPRVDYLLKNGGLPYMISKRLVQSQATSPVHQYSTYHSPQIPQFSASEEYQKVFAGQYKRLEDFLQVLRCNGSVAVATGYRSVARRLLDKLSQVFARDISSERCDCVICKTTPQPYLSDEEDSGISWGEILEFVSGRRELPQWPPFIIQPEEDGLGIHGTTEAPMQKIDIDVPEEYRDHYKRQNQKTKVAVQQWLELQPVVPSSPPEEADEDTLMFAMMTKLSVQDRNLLIALMHGQSSISDSRAPTPAERPSTPSPSLKRARRALQRLYRLERPPRDCECAMYLLNNVQLHSMLATLAEVNEQEWDILISGRFDGFLWSGAEMTHNSFTSPAVSRGPSRNQTTSPLSRNATPFSGLSGIQSRGQSPFGSSPLRNVMSPDAFAVHTTPMFPSRGPTPGYPISAAGPAPVQLDEETEIAVLAELERNIYTDMERLEDAFELLHGRAEQVRQLLRERSAGLSVQAQLRRGSLGVDPGVRLDTPASGFTNFEDEEDDDGLGDVASLAPDDSASQISFNRRVRKRRERQTPAPVAEEDEGDGGAVAEKDKVRDRDRDRDREREKRKDGRRSAPRR